MLYTIEDIKRLMSGSTEHEKEDNGTIRFLLSGAWHFTTQDHVRLLLDARRQLEIAREGLATLSKETDLEKAGLRTVNARTLRVFARETLAKIEGVGK